MWTSTRKACRSNAWSSPSPRSTSNTRASRPPAAAVAPTHSATRCCLHERRPAARTRFHLSAQHGGFPMSANITRNGAEELLAAGDTQGALELLQRQVRERAADPKLRVFLFQLLCVLGQWQRAFTQLQVCGEMDAAALPMVNTYREALQCEAVREAVF